MAESTQQRLARVRPPRVQIQYDVEDGGATVSRELPLVAGVVGDFSGDGRDPTEYAQRQFIEVEAGGVSNLMRRIRPELKFTVEDRISGATDAEIAVNLKFESTEDFSPMGVASQLPETTKLLEARQRLADLYGKIESNEFLDGLLGEVLADADKKARLRQELGLEPETGE